MTDNAIEEMKIWHLINAWGHARDSGDWDALQNCFCSDASIDIAWIKAPAKEFVARSIQMAANREPGAHQKHMFTGPLVRINGERAFSICHVQLEHRDTMQAYTFDLQSWFRFFDLLLKEEDGCWRIHKRTAVYEKDRINPTDPRGVPAELFKNMELSNFPAATKYLSWYQTTHGRKMRTDIVQVYSQEEAALKVEGLAWLES